MTVEIPAELVPFVESVIASGRCSTESDVVGEALRIFRDLDSRQDVLRREVVEGINSGESIPGDEVFARMRRRAAEIESNAR